MKIMVVGNSTVLMVKPYRTSRAGGGYFEHIELELEARGISDAVTVNRAEWYGLITGSLRLQHEIRAFSPDILIIQYGTNEAGLSGIPYGLFKMLYSWMLYPAPGRQTIQKRAARRLWKPARAWQRQVGLRFGRWAYRVRPRRFKAELLRLLDAVKRDTRSFVFLVDVFPPNEAAEYWLPGQRQRTHVINGIISKLALDAGAIHVPVHDLCLKWGPAAVPDGFHLSADAHLRLAQYIADLITMCNAKALI